MEENNGLDIMSMIIGMTKGKAEGEKSITLNADEGYTITDTNNDGHVAIITTGAST